MVQSELRKVSKMLGNLTFGPLVYVRYPNARSSPLASSVPTNWALCSQENIHLISGIAGRRFQR
jgi:hypothetical protein